MCCCRGDTLEIKSNQIYINGKPEIYPEEAIFNHRFYSNYKKFMLLPNDQLFEDYEIYYKSDISQNHEFKTQSQVLRIDSIYNSDSSSFTIDTTQKMEISNVNYLTCSHSTKEKIKLKYPGWDSVITEKMNQKGIIMRKTSNIVQFTPITLILIGQETILDPCISQQKEG